MAVKKVKTYVWRSPRGLATMVTVVMAINLLIRLASVTVWATFGAAASYVGATQFTGLQLFRWVLDVTQLLVLVASISSLVWIYRACENAHTFRRRLVNSPWGSILWYLVPIATLFKPFQAMSEIWQASAVNFKRGEDRILGAWWAALLVNSVVNSALLAVRSDVAPATTGIIEGISGAVVTVFFVIIVRRVTAMQIFKHTVEPFGDSPASESVLERLLG